MPIIIDSECHICHIDLPISGEEPWQKIWHPATRSSDSFSGAAYRPAAICPGNCPGTVRTADQPERCLPKSFPFGGSKTSPPVWQAGSWEAYYQYVGTPGCPAHLHMSCTRCGKTFHMNTTHAKHLICIMLEQDGFDPDILRYCLIWHLPRLSSFILSFPIYKGVRRIWAKERAWAPPVERCCWSLPWFSLCSLWLLRLIMTAAVNIVLSVIRFKSVKHFWSSSPRSALHLPGRRYSASLPCFSSCERRGRSSHLRQFYCG